MSARDTILARNLEMYKMYNRGDYDGIAAGYTEKGMVYQPGENPVVGRSAIKANAAKKSNFKTMELENTEFFEQFGENTAYSLETTKCLDAQGRVVARYKGAILWRKIGGTWYIEHDIFNDLPK